ncbi:hypothetical protein GETHLI_22140 [Geothrix limicola]|uniref:Uncharacterized protein n=1 Tax=Geothrix limicola TaxID=2927978 RepID=A0ABQ5QGJ0_9BACT|nr:hypothetical protein GETHLI_22140 [Geothrix limicola]
MKAESRDEEIADSEGQQRAGNNADALSAQLAYAWDEESHSGDAMYCLNPGEDEAYASDTKKRYHH